MIRFLFYILTGYFVFRAAGFLLKLMRGLPPAENPPPASSVAAELIQDPQCGSWFLKERGVQAKVHGKTMYFCSDACRDAWLKRR